MSLTADQETAQCHHKASHKAFPSSSTAQHAAPDRTGQLPTQKQQQHILHPSTVSMEDATHQIPTQQQQQQIYHQPSSAVKHMASACTPDSTLQFPTQQQQQMFNHQYNSVIEHSLSSMTEQQNIIYDDPSPLVNCFISKVNSNVAQNNQMPQQGMQQTTTEYKWPIACNESLPGGSNVNPVKTNQLHGNMMHQHPVQNPYPNSHLQIPINSL